MDLNTFIYDIGVTLVLPTITAFTEVAFWVLIKKEPPDFKKIGLDVGQKLAANIAYWIYLKKDFIFRFKSEDNKDDDSLVQKEEDLDKFFEPRDSISRDYTLVEYDPEIFSSFDTNELLKCPISGKVIENPVISKNGVVYEEQSVKLFFSDCERSKQLNFKILSI